MSRSNVRLLQMHVQKRSHMCCETKHSALEQSDHPVVEAERSVQSTCRSFSFWPSGLCYTLLETQKPVCLIYLWMSSSFLWKATKSQIGTAEVRLCPSVWPVSRLPSGPMSVCNEYIIILWCKQRVSISLCTAAGGQDVIGRTLPTHRSHSSRVSL